MKEGFFSNKKFPLTITILLLLIGSVIYFTIDSQKIMDKKENVNVSTVASGVYKNILIKAAYTKEGQLKVFAQNENNKLAKLKAYEGNPIPETDSIVIGYDEAKMMKEEKLFNKTGDQIKGLFGTNVKIEGVLEKEDSPIDDFHFVSLQTISKIDGDFDRMYIKVNSDGVPKLFYRLNVDEIPKFNITLKEGKFQDYNAIHEIVGEAYYPMMVGSKEAKMMKEEKLFSKPGDIIKDFFGKNVVIVGVMTETNSSLDMVHITPLKSGESN